MEHRLTVNRDEFHSNLLPFVNAYEPSDLSRFVLSFDGKTLHVTTEQGGCLINAKGTWPGQVIIRSNEEFMQTVRNLPKVPQFIIRVTNNLFYLAGTPMPCRSANMPQSDIMAATENRTAEEAKKLLTKLENPSDEVHGPEESATEEEEELPLDENGEVVNVITFKCLLCARSLDVPADMAGQVMVCPACNRRIGIPPPQSECVLNMPESVTSNIEHDTVEPITPTPSDLTTNPRAKRASLTLMAKTIVPIDFAAGFGAISAILAIAAVILCGFVRGISEGWASAGLRGFMIFGGCSILWCGLNWKRLNTRPSDISRMPPMTIEEAEHIIDIVAAALVKTSPLMQICNTNSLLKHFQPLSDLKGYDMFQIDIALKLRIANTFLYLSGRTNFEEEFAKEVRICTFPILGMNFFVPDELFERMNKFVKSSDKSSLSREEQFREHDLFKETMPLTEFFIENKEWLARETGDSFGKYCISVGANDPLYWQKIYTRLGLEYTTGAPRRNFVVFPPQLEDKR